MPAAVPANTDALNAELRGDRVVRCAFNDRGATRI